jgi:DNA-binding response OmpR family regulator
LVNYGALAADGAQQMNNNIAKKTIAVVEDDLALAATLEDMLVAEGYHPVLCASAAALKTAMADDAIDLILLDLNLPDGNGLTLAAQIRAKTSVPIIILTGKGSEVDRIVGLEVGADDYVVKPFSVREVAARIRAVLRRGTASVATPPEVTKGYRFAGWTLDVELRRLFDPQGNQVFLTVNEYEIFSAIVAASGRILSRNQLIEMTRRHDNDDVFDRTVDVLIMRVRRKVEANTRLPKLIVTERGLGYRLSSKVERFGFD